MWNLIDRNSALLGGQQTNYDIGLIVKTLIQRKNNPVNCFVPRCVNLSGSKSLALWSHEGWISRRKKEKVTWNNEELIELGSHEGWISRRKREICQKWLNLDATREEYQSVKERDWPKMIGLGWHEGQISRHEKESESPEILNTSFLNIFSIEA